MKIYRNARAALYALAILPLALPVSAQPTASPNSGKAPLSPTDSSKDRLPDPGKKELALGKVELGPRPDVTITEITFIGAGVPVNVGKAAQKFVGKKASAEALTKLAAAMSKAYARSSVALFTLVIPEQDLSGGVVKVVSAEGHVTSVLLSGETEQKQTRLVNAMVKPLPGLKPLSRARFERIIGNVDDIPGLESKSTLATSGEPGGVVLGMELDAKKPTVGFGFTSRTSQFVRDGIFEANAKGYSLARSGDETVLNAAASVNFESLKYVSFRHDTPIGADGTRVSLSAAALETKPVGLSAKGNAWSGGLSVRHPLIRGTRRNLTFGATLDYLDSRNALFGSQLAAEKSWIAGASLLWRLNEEKTALAVRLAGAKGLDIFNARVDPLVGEAGFTYVEAGVEANRSLGKQAVFRLAAFGRYTRDRIPAAQRLSVGGATFGRAFDDGLVNGDRGWATFGEFAYRPVKKGKFAASEIYAFADYADVRLRARGLNPAFDFKLGSAGGGMRLAYSDKATIGVEAVKAWKNPVPGFDQGWRFALTWRLSFRP